VAVRYWINTVSREHVLAGVAGGFTQANHGRATNLRRLAGGDLIVFYSPRTSYPDGAPLRRFTAVGRVADSEPYQAAMSPAFRPWRRRVAYLPCEEAPIGPLLGALGFIADPRRWGVVFRRGLFEIPADDFQRLAGAMRAEVAGGGLPEGPPPP
jgi:EVE domain